MRYIFMRLQPRWRRKKALLVGVVVAAILVAFLFVPIPTPPAELRLVALGENGQFADTVFIPLAWSDTATSVPGAIRRVPLIMAVRNQGRSSGRPGVLELSMPVRYRLVDADARPLPASPDPAAPLIRYRFTGSFPSFDPDRLPDLMPGLDTLWLEPILPAFYCVELADGVPEFLPSPGEGLSSLSRLSIFYSLDGGDLEERQTGILALQLDSAIVAQRPQAAPPRSEVEIREPEVELPELGPLRLVGSRSASCGAPESPMELLSTLWETEDGGRFFVIDHAGAARKYLFDLDRDDVIEREVWDPDGDGRFEATRVTRLTIPEFVMPIRGVATFDLAAFEGIPPDSMARLDAYAGAMVGPAAVGAPVPDTSSLAVWPGLRQTADRTRRPALAGPAPTTFPADEARTMSPQGGAFADSLPVPQIRRPAGPLGRPLDTLPSRRDTTGVPR